MESTGSTRAEAADSPPPDPETGSEVNLELTKHRVWDHVDDKIEQRLDRRDRRLGTIVLVFVTVAGLFGYQTISDMTSTVTRDVASNVESSLKEQTRTLRDDVHKQLASLNVAVRTAEVTGADVEVLREQVEQSRGTASKLVEALETERQALAGKLEALDQLKADAEKRLAELQVLDARMLALQDKIEARLSTLDAIDERIDRLQSLVNEQTDKGGPPEEKFQPLTPEERAALRIEQRVLGTDTSTKRPLTTLEFLVVVADPGIPEARRQQMLQQIRNVDYYLNPSWFKEMRQRFNRSDAFKFTARVWGITRVGAKIHFADGSAPEVRCGYMSLTQEKRLEQPDADEDTCPWTE